MTGLYLPYLRLYNIPFEMSYSSDEIAGNRTAFPGTCEPP